jgi:hypothetical protein
MQTSVQYGGLEFDVIGDFVPYSKATRDEPSEGGYLDDARIMLGEHDVTDMLDYDYRCAIETLAVQGMGK